MDPVDLAAEYRAELRAADAFRSLRATWKNNSLNDADWLEFCQDFDWDVATLPKGEV